ncbi:phosphatase PAP2 family protein [Lentilactobacillus sp. SPB1-3]|uniref:Phosphatase PAP2 family protein n=1 Tax=Lentilactobacillus terminaliae TaxID=3003483 RepID=A0ACD5DH30_9LACO|nr:phosphatase PAP2 family protein [Lentilactobacillus sp. SPB1-3]MCZ0977011.1 phosphatase PAP2 family protein [Lentilactobacillus sp. SPB1-3]
MNKTNYRNQKIVIYISLVIFLILAWMVVGHFSPLQHTDEQVQAWIRSGINPTQTSIMIHVTNLMGSKSSLVIILVIIVGLLAFKQLGAALFVTVNSMLLSYPMNVGLKLLINRPRPSIHHLVTVHSTSFPSGHAMISIMLAGSLIILINNHWRRNIATMTAVLLLSLFILIIGYSRVYLGVHYPSDVLAGYCVGLLTINLVYILFKRWQIL